MIGLVLCGGQSKRMGTDKGLLLADHETWANIAANKLRSFHLPVKFSVNIYQEKTYGDLLQQENLIVDNPKLAVGGPLKGILSAHLAYPDTNFLVLACDLLLMSETLIEKLIATKQAKPGFEAYIFQNIEFDEPLCGIYSVEGLKRIYQKMQEGLLQKYSMQYVLSQLQTYKINLGLTEYEYFKNFNLPF